MTMTRIKFEILHEGFAGITFGFVVPVPADSDRNAHVFASEEVMRGFASSLRLEADKMDTILLDLSSVTPVFDPDVMTVKSVSVEADAFGLLRFQVATPDGETEQADARDFADASLLAAAKFAFQGKNFSLLTEGEGFIYDCLKSLKALDRGVPVVQATRCEFEVRDWRVAEGEGDTITEAQAQPMKFSIVSGGYGPMASFRRGDEEYTVSMEIDEGCVVARSDGLSSDNMIASIRTSRDCMQVDMCGTDGTQKSYLVSDRVIPLHDGKLTQDGAAISSFQA